MEYLLVVDGVQENLISAMVAGGTCAPVTDYSGYANRKWMVSDADSITNTYNQCGTCQDSINNHSDTSASEDTAADVRILTITTEVCDSASSVRITGPWWSWDPSGGPEAVSNGDGTYSFTFNPAPDADMEYLLVVDGVQENLISAMVAGGTCAPVTDYSGYANRKWMVSDADSITNTYNQCGTCQDSINNHSDTSASEDTAADVRILTITTEVCDSASSVRITGPWWSWDPSGGPEAVSNGDGTYSFTFNPAPDADMEYLLVVDGVQENLISAMVAGGTCAPVTDYYSYANRKWLVTDADTIYNTYKQCGSCQDSITTNLEDPNSLTYIYPNPNEGMLQITNFPLTSLVEIYSLSGAKVYEELVISNRQILNINELRAGMYFIRSGQIRLKFYKN